MNPTAGCRWMNPHSISEATQISTHALPISSSRYPPIYRPRHSPEIRSHQRRAPLEAPLNLIPSRFANSEWIRQGRLIAVSSRRAQGRSHFGSRTSRSRMGNFKSKASENPQVTKIVDKVWDRFASTSEHGALGVQDLYCAILLVYNDINKKLPGPFNDPPTKEEVEELLKTFDKNQDGFLDRTEFTAFIATFTKNVSARVSTNILLFSFVIPTVVTLARPGAETLPLLGPVVKKAPTPIYSAVMTTLIVFAGSQFRRT